MKIPVIQGTRYSDVSLLSEIRRNKKLAHIGCEVVNMLYSPCWIFVFDVTFGITKKSIRHVGCCGGFDELAMTPGLITSMPETGDKEVDGVQVLVDKLDCKKAEELTWSYCKKWVIRRNRILFRPPVCADVKMYKQYKALYLMKFNNKKNGQMLYKAFDSITGDFENIVVKTENRIKNEEVLLCS